jgi:hypothetical protein
LVFGMERYECRAPLVVSPLELTALLYYEGYWCNSFQA